MGAPRLLLPTPGRSRRKPSPPAADAGAPAPPSVSKPASSNDENAERQPRSGPFKNGFLLPRRSKPNATAIHSEARAGSDSSGEGTADSSASSPAAHDSRANPTNPPGNKRAVHLSISPDDGSESVQVMLMNGRPSPQKGDDCLYTVGSVDYLVKHGDGSVNNSDEGGAEEGQADDHTNEAPVEASAGDEGKKKSKRGGLFRKSGGKKGSNDGDKEVPDNNQSNDNDGGNDGGGSGDNNNEDEKKDDGRSNHPPPPGTPFDPLTYFGPARATFAAQSTLPLHPGPENTAPKDHPSWTPVDGTEFKVRRGPNYPKNGKKERSLPSLYEVYAVRYFRSGKRTVGGATRIMPLPDLAEGREGAANGVADEGDRAEKNKGANGTADEVGTATGGIQHHPELDGTKVPDVLVVHFMLPYEPPNVFKQRDDGPGGECVYYLRPTRRFLDELAGQIPPTPATLLFAKWCAECEHTPAVRGRFKCMALVRDIDRHNFGLLKNYNGKPVLITESGRVCSGYHGNVRYLEMTANVHYWAFMAKKGFVSLMPKFANMQMEVGFTIEAHADSEMPECMLGSTVLSYIGERTGPMISPEMQEPVHEHQS